ncbi:uncharacterized protein AB9W97_016511 [Spinachia spinachia]
MAVITVPTGGRSPLSSLHPILKAFCFAAQTHTSVTTALGTMQIMAGLFNIGLGPGRTSTGSGDLSSLGAAYWLGSVFVLTGIMSILAGQFPSSCLVGFTVFMNIAGAIFAVTGIVLYVVDLRKASVLWMCERGHNKADYYEDKCAKVALFAQTLLASMDTTLVAAAVLHLFGDVRFVVLGIEALVSGIKDEEVWTKKTTNKMVKTSARKYWFALSLDEPSVQVQSVRSCQPARGVRMSVSVVKDRPVTVATGGESTPRPLCPILRALCCSGSAVPMERDVTAALGTMQIMVGLFNIGLGPGRPSVTFTGAASWLGGVFSAAGIVSALAGRFPSLYLVGVAVLVNIVGSLSAVVGIAQSSLDLAAAPAAGMCDGDAAELRDDHCLYVAHYFQRLLTALDVTLIVLALLHLCVSISFAALGIKALVNRKREAVGKDDEDQHLLMKEAVLTTPAA